eukprot:339402_1
MSGIDLNNVLNIYRSVLDLPEEYIQIVVKLTGVPTDERTMEPVAKFLINTESYQKLIDLLEEHLNRFKTEGYSPGFNDVRCVVSRLTISKTFSRVLARDTRFWEFVGNFVELELSSKPEISAEHQNYYEQMRCELTGDICTVIFTHAKAAQWDILRKTKFLAILRQRLTGTHYAGAWYAFKHLGLNMAVSRVATDMDRVWVDRSLGKIGREMSFLVKAFADVGTTGRQPNDLGPPIGAGCKSCWAAKTSTTAMLLNSFAVPMWNTAVRKYKKTKKTSDFTFTKTFHKQYSDVMMTAMNQ